MKPGPAVVACFYCFFLKRCDVFFVKLASEQEPKNRYSFENGFWRDSERSFLISYYAYLP